jgi:hypothetical protein
MAGDESRGTDREERQPAIASWLDASVMRAGRAKRRRTVESLAVSLTGQRAGRLFRLLTLLGNGPLTRQQILRKLRIDVRGFYRDLEALRALGVEVEAGDDNRYTLALDFDEAMARLPFPDPGLNFRDVQQLAKGETSAHRKLRRRINTFLGNGTRSPLPNKPR